MFLAIAFMFVSNLCVCVFVFLSLLYSEVWKGKVKVTYLYFVPINSVKKGKIFKLKRKKRPLS